jgi:hypothetical protein
VNIQLNGITAKKSISSIGNPKKYIPVTYALLNVHKSLLTAIASIITNITNGIDIAAKNLLKGL